MQTPNGWKNSGGFIDCIWSTDEIAWFRERNQQWIDACLAPVYNLPPIPDQDPITLRVEYLQTALEISNVGDAGIYLLNPQVVTKEDEREAWFS